MKRCIPLVFIVTLPLLALAQTQNPRALFDFTAKVLLEEYINPREFNIPQVLEKYKAQLDKICQDPTACTSESTKNVVREMLDTFQDAHLGFVEDNRELSRVGTSNPTGRFGFFGKTNDKAFVITYIYPESPAETAGLLVGDQIVTVDGTEPKIGEMVRAIRTKEVSFSETRFSVLSRGNPKEVLLRATDSRGYLSVTHILEGNVRRIRVPEANLYQEQEFHNQIFKALESGTKTLVLDLRDNAGGSSVASLKMAAAFLKNLGALWCKKMDCTGFLNLMARGFRGAMLPIQATKANLQGKLNG